MARIRTVKPEFFRHELLQDLEITYAKNHPMLVFAGLWGHCDKAGRFEWKPRQLKLDILPFLDFDMEETLSVLEKAGLLKKYVVGLSSYGVIPTFGEHQRIGGKEATDGEKYPPPPERKTGKQRGSNGEATGKQSSNASEAVVKHQGLQEGKGREGSRATQRERGSRLPADWAPTELLLAWAAKERSDLDLTTTVAKFRDYWQSKPGIGATKLDWDATFRNWIREEKPGRQPPKIKVDL